MNKKQDREHGADASKEIDFGNMTGEAWVDLLVKRPRFASRCDWSKLDGSDWARLLIKQPQFADKCDWGKLDSYDWLLLLAEQPQFADKCDWGKLDAYEWQLLLAEHPQFADKCDWSKLDGGDWAKLLARQPQFADKCDWTKLSLENLSDLFAQNPKLRALAKKKRGMRGKILQIVLVREWVSATYELGRKALTSGEIPNSRGWNESSDGPEMLSDVLDDTAFFVIAKPCDPFQRDEGHGHTHSEAIIIRLDGKELVNRTLNKSNPGARLRFVDEGDLFDEAPPQEGRWLYGAQWWKDLWWSWTVEVPKEFDIKKAGKLVIPFFHARTGADRYPQLWINPDDIHYGDMKPNEATSGWHMDDGRPKGIDFWTVEGDVPVPYDGPWTHVRD